MQAEMFKTAVGLHGTGALVDALHTLFLHVQATGEPPSKWRVARLIPLLKPGRKDVGECDNYRGVTLVDMVTKIYAYMLLARVGPWLKDHLLEIQMAFQAERGATDNLFILRDVMEMFKQRARDLYIGFVDLKKAFDSVNREALFRILQQHYGLPAALVAMIRVLYTGTKMTVAWADGFSDPFAVDTGVKQGCVLSPLLFCVFLDFITREALHRLQNAAGVRWDIYGLDEWATNPATPHYIRSIIINILLYADDAVVLAESHAQLHLILRVLCESCATWGLLPNYPKTEVMMCRFSPDTLTFPPPPIVLGGHMLTWVSSYKYLGSVISADGKCTEAIEARIKAAWGVFWQLERVWRLCGISRRTKGVVFNASVMSTLLYGAECWTYLQPHLTRLNTFVRDCLNIITNTRRSAYVPDETLRQWCGVKPIAWHLKTRRMQWLGHVLRMGVTDKDKPTVTVLQPDAMQRLPVLTIHGWPARIHRGRLSPAETWRSQAIKMMQADQSRDPIDEHLKRAREKKTDWREHWRRPTFTEPLERRTCPHCGYMFEDSYICAEHIARSTTCRSRRAAMAMAP
jgi:hypothetical protein